MNNANDALLGLSASNSLAVVILGRDTFLRGYLPLRYDILYRELRWATGNIVGPQSLLDAYDSFSQAFGIVDYQSKLLAAGRLIMTEQVDELPSIAALKSRQKDCAFAPPVAELSRLLVAKPYRGLGLFRILLQTGISLAADAGIGSLILTERDNARYSAFMHRNGFNRVADDFTFFDLALAPNEPSATYLFKIPDKNQSEISAIAMATALQLVRSIKITQTAINYTDADISNDCPP